MVELECIPYGAGQADEGVCLLVRMGPYRILLDCGLSDITALPTSAVPFQHLPSDLRSDVPADLVLCSHAHPDHARGLLALHQAFPQLPIYASEVTAHLLPLNWPELEPAVVPSFCRALPWRSPVEFGDGLTAQLFPAGHLPGAAAFLLTYTPPPPPGSGVAPHTYSLFYTGDFFLSNSRLVEGLPLAELRGLSPDVLILEGTFGTTRHPHRRQQENQLAERITQALSQGFCILLPVPVLGPGQELLMLLRSHHYFTGKDLDIWVDEAIAAGCDAYLEILSHLPSTVQNFAQHQPLFWDQRVRPRVRRLPPEAHALINQSPCIVLADKNVDVAEFCRPEGHPWLLLLPQRPAQVKATPTLTKVEQRLVDPVTAAIAHFQPLIRSNQLRIETYLLAQHCDGPGTTQLIHNLRPQHVVLIHGTPTYLADLAALDELHNRYHLHTPAIRTLVELPVGEDWVQPAATPASETSYEGELNELGTVVTVTLPGAITDDPRWQEFADTGLVQASWQGEALVLHGITQRDLLLEQTLRFDTHLNRCSTCKHFRSQRCWNQASPLFGFKVTPEGYCPAFEPVVDSVSQDQNPN